MSFYEDEDDPGNEFRGFLVKAPAGQSDGDTAPAGQNAPLVHVSHAVAPTALWYPPTSHAAHSPELPFGATVPAAHGVGALAPSEHA